jgi:hypothetical protein
MRYALLIYTDESVELPPEEQNAVSEAYSAYTNEVRERGIMQAGEALQSTSTASTVRVRDGETMISDGPFAETKEQLGGFYLLECKDLDEAIEYAAKIPASARGSIEVRPIWEFPEA